MADKGTAANKLLLLQKEQAEAILAIKKEFASGLEALVKSLDGLSASLIAEVITEPVLEPSLKALGLVSVNTVRPPWTPPKSPSSVTPKLPKATGVKRGKKGGNSEKILACLTEDGLTTGDIKKAINYTGANLSAVLAGIKKAGKIKKTGEMWYKA